jgi:predicted RNA-binding protein YlxR (DUF448 family)
MAKQAIEGTLEKAQRGFPARSFIRGELALKGEGHRCTHPVLEAIPSRTRPTRMCLGCRERAAQIELIRIFSLHPDNTSHCNNSSHCVEGARSENPSVALSTSERSWCIVPPFQKDEHPVSLHGRSAYVHNTPSCFKSACIAQRLQRAFRETVSMERARALLTALEAIEAPEQVIDRNISEKTTSSKNGTKIFGMNADLQYRGLQDCGGEASTRTEQIKREAKK